MCCCKSSLFVSRLLCAAGRSGVELGGSDTTSSGDSIETWRKMPIFTTTVRAKNLTKNDDHAGEVSPYASNLHGIFIIRSFTPPFITVLLAVPSRANLLGSPICTLLSLSLSQH